MPQILDRFRSSTLGWLLGTLAGWGTCFLFLAGLIGSFYFLAQGTLVGAAWVAPLLLAVAIVVLILKWFENLGVAYEITEDRLILHKGILQKSIDEIELYRVKDVRIDFSIINQLADIGTISIASSDETTREAPLVIRDVAKARLRRERLRELVNTARRNRGVREIDMVHEDLGEPPLS
ncbi:PH domain-containing protein [Sphingomonas sp. HITSZ_GF]|uniref:PH domain-containing protein n=1 Tax=Sphingomonas sp. HITSZ_GF TaxID=3037247 RepID=UPI00240D5536|nr:PH domain-containing protein [Sphingomonas sp. HITSZ_GF]MDG2535392.1 PH domain-containing protein [Sphingomonas sp. HITSZ_GF]